MFPNPLDKQVVNDEINKNNYDHNYYLMLPIQRTSKDVEEEEGMRSYYYPPQLQRLLVHCFRVCGRDTSKEDRFYIFSRRRTYSRRRVVGWSGGRIGKRWRGEGPLGVLPVALRVVWLEFG